MQYDIVVCDFDDTLLRDDHTISKKTLEVIDEFQNRGGKFIICTGRMFASIVKEARKFNLKGLVSSFQGALIGDIESGKHLMEFPLPKELAIKKLKLLEERGCYIQIYDEYDNLFSNGFNDYSKAYKKWTGIPVQPQNIPLSKFVSDGNFMVFKILVADDNDKIRNLYNEMKLLDSDELVYSISKPVLMEIVHKSASKGTAVKIIAQKFGVDISKVICIGDSLNDMPMLEVAGLSVAVSNANQEIKDRVKYITSSNNDDGVAKVIEKFCLGR